MARPRILFFSQGVSLAHVGRPLALAESLDPRRYEVHFARTAANARFVASPHLTQHEVRESLTPADFVRRLARGQALFDLATLEADIAEDLRVLQAVRPDVVVGDFRLSLQVSARRLGIPFALLTNAYWSPALPLERLPVPEHLAVRLLGLPLATVVFRKAFGLAFRQHAEAFNVLRRRAGRSPFTDVRQAYHEADELLFADAPAFFPERGLGGRFLGPVQWEPTVGALPAWWDRLEGRDRVFVSVGSTGSSRLLTSEVVSAVSACGVEVMVATAERGAAPEGVLTAPYLPGLQAARKARAMVCSGGSATLSQALAAGIPALAICSNMDQMLAAERSAAAGAVVPLRADQASAAVVRQALTRLLVEPSFTRAARALAPSFAPSVATQAFERWLEQRLSIGLAA